MYGVHCCRVSLTTYLYLFMQTKTQTGKNTFENKNRQRECQVEQKMPCERIASFTTSCRVPLTANLASLQKAKKNTQKTGKVTKGQQNGMFHFQDIFWGFWREKSFLWKIFLFCKQKLSNWSKQLFPAHKNMVPRKLIWIFYNILWYLSGAAFCWQEKTAAKKSGEKSKKLGKRNR